jgi:diaminopimelate epimerase
MKLELTKHHGLGNDFVVVFHPAVDDLPALARYLCDRRRGIGADGLLVGDGEPGHAARMVLYNADGSRAEMSGNGIRCFAQALAERRGNLDDQLIATDAGPRLVRLAATEEADTLDISVDMGPVMAIAAPAGWHEIGCNPDRPVAHLSVGNPHTVVGVDDVSAVDLVALGSQVPCTNLELVEPGHDGTSIRMRVHERGAGVTEACGTGACASAWAAVSWGLVPASTREIMVHMDGGGAKVRLDDPVPGHVTLIGPTVFVAHVLVEVPDARFQQTPERQL